MVSWTVFGFLNRRKTGVLLSGAGKYILQCRCGSYWMHALLKVELAGETETICPTADKEEDKQAQRIRTTVEKRTKGGRGTTG